MKKVLFVCVMVLSLAALVFAGGKSDSASGGEGVTTLTFMGWEASPLETDAVKNGIAAFERANPGTKVSYTPTSGDYLPKLLSSLASNSPPDVFFVGSGDYRTLSSRGVLLDITDRFNTNYPLNDFIDSSRTIMSINNRVYGISSCSVSPIIYYNRDIFDKYNEPYPSADPSRVWTIDEFRAVAKRLTRDGIYGCYGLETNGIMVNVQVISGGGSQFSPDYNTSTYNSPAVKKVLQIIKAIRMDDKSMPSSSTLENVGMNAAQMLQTGKIAMLLDGSWALQQLSTLGFPVGIAPVPSYGKAVTTGQAHLHAIAKASKHPEEAWKYLQFLSGMEYQGQLCKEGLWLPNRKSLWADGSGGIDGWYDDARLGPYYRQMRDYLIDVIVEPSAMQKASICGDIIAEEQDKFFKDNENIDTILANIERRTNAELKALQ
ncbi:MAG: sugar ABC transporter substrate-binding protein [Treponema sp.]|jgi:multiple sugar transport system substrate-binding protein|nr:sugar ABC transporter substrate-binding protein [Treponema sp.]